MTEKKCYNLIKRDWDETQSLFLSQGMQWYPIENEYCRDIANKHNRDIITVSGLFAVFSPIKSVRENKNILENYLKGRKYGHTQSQMNKAHRIANSIDLDEISNILHGNKTIAFFRHLYNPMDKEVSCIDSHMIKYFNQGDLIHITPKRYKIMSNSVKKFAKDVNLLPSEVQATLWLRAKSLYGINV